MKPPTLGLTKPVQTDIKSIEQITIIIYWVSDYELVDLTITIQWLRTQLELLQTLQSYISLHLSPSAASTLSSVSQFIL